MPAICDIEQNQNIKKSTATFRLPALHLDISISSWPWNSYRQVASTRGHTDHTWILKSWTDKI